MRFLMAVLALGLLLVKPVAAQQAVRAPSPPAPAQSRALTPAVSQWQSYRPRLGNDRQQLRSAVAGDRDLTSEKIAIAVVVVVLAVVIIRSVK
jgi:hypothetical protein